MKAPTVDILHQDDDMLIVGKPAGLLSIPDRFSPDRPNLQALLSEAMGRVFTVHRLDRDTSGVLCFARHEEAHRHLSAQFEQRTVKKTYLALVDGQPTPPEGSIELSIVAHPTVAGKMTTAKRGKPSLTTYTTEAVFRRFTLMRVHIHTGRTHQVRVHFKAIGHPLAVDALYGVREALFVSDIKTKALNQKTDAEPRPLMGRTSLHALSLGLVHPRTGEAIVAEAPLPKDFRALLNQLNKWGK